MLHGRFAPIRKGGLAEFTDAVVNRSEVQKMIEWIHCGVNPVAEAMGYNKMTTLMEIRLQDGKNITGRGGFCEGSPAIPMSYGEVADKFLDCAAFAKWSPQRAKSTIELVNKLETLGDIRTLVALFSKS